MNKEALRQKYKILRQNIPDDRRLEAKKSLLDDFYPSLKKFSHILSFASFKDEIDLWALNDQLAKEHRLYLPKMEAFQILPYQVDDPQNQLLKSPYGPLEPNPRFCPKLPIKNLDCILVPGLCFDTNHHRLGYGFGHFDRFLKLNLSIPTFGIGFKEQLMAQLPIEPHDVPLTKVYLF